MDLEKRKKQKREAQQRYRLTDKGKASDARWCKSPAFKLAKARYSKKWRLRNPLKYKAHYLVDSALKSGKLKKGVCVVCGSNSTVAHHDDYLKPLAVRWLCRKHHNEVHCLPAYLKEKARCIYSPCSTEERR